MDKSTKFGTTAVGKSINNLEDSIAELSKVQCKDDHVYRYPSQTQHSSLTEWAIQFRNE